MRARPDLAVSRGEPGGKQPAVTWPPRASSPADVAGARPRGTPRAPPGGTPAGAEMIVTRLLAARSGVAARSRRTIGPWPGRDWHAVGVSTVDRPEITGIR